MLSKLPLILTLSIAHPIYSENQLEKAQECYHRTPQYKEWQEFKEEVEKEKTLENLLVEFFDLKTKCKTQESGFRKKCAAECIEADMLSDEIIKLKNKLHNLEEAAIQTHEGQEYLKQRQAFFGKK